MTREGQRSGSLMSGSWPGPLFSCNKTKHLAHPGGLLSVLLLVLLCCIDVSLVNIYVIELLFYEFNLHAYKECLYISCMHIKSVLN